jgi:hypothetical protein
LAAPAAPARRRPRLPSPAHPDANAGLRDLLLRTELAGTQRRALLLHTDRLPHALSRPQHQRLARAAITALTQADRAQPFELSRGRIAIIWRDRGGRELETTMAAIGHLLADLPESQAMPLGQLASVYDLPEQADWLLDELGEESGHAHANGATPTRPLDVAVLARLEQALAQADMSRFIRWRPVLLLAGAAPVTAWEERYVAAHDIAATLCPDRRIKAEPWLFRRLTRSFDRRMLASMSTTQDLRDSGPFALNLNVGTMLGPEFLRFDAALPAALRGEVTLNLTAPDILSDPSGFVFARNFVSTRGYRLLLRHGSAALLALFDVGAAELDYVEIPYTRTLAADPDSPRLLLPANVQIVLTGVTSPQTMDWARSHGFPLVRGA